MSAATLSAEDMMMSVDDVLGLSEVMSGEYETEVRKFNLQSELNILLANFADSAGSKSIELHVDNRLPSQQVIEADQDKVSHVLRHMIGNAIKFSTGGDVWVKMELRGETQVCVSVADSGPGIPEAKIDELLSPFKQSDGSFSRRHQGMGIGLAICRAYADSVAGEFVLLNRPEGGLLAQFIFPFQSSRGVESLDQPLVNLEGNWNTAGFRVLVVEDNPINQMVLKGFLAKLGCAVETANNGEEALGKLTSQFDLVFMDCQMPVLDGFEATRKIRAMSEPEKSVPIIAVTANAMVADRNKCFQAGMNGYLKKPVNFSTIAGEVHRYAKTVA